MDANQINNNICEAIETIVQAELEKRSYDTTIICIITDDSKRLDGAYTVTDGSIKFEAYSESPDYRVGDQVLVSIQQGDWSMAKTIIRKYSANNEEDPVAYVPPLGTMLSMTDNLAKYGKWQIADYPPVGILANGSVTQKCIWAINLNELDQLDLRNNEIYSVIGLRASFRTLFGSHDYDIREGRYGLRLQIDYVSNPGAELQQSGTIEYVLDSRQDMFGDPYTFLTYFSQEKKIDISKLGTITQLRLFLYQTGNFAYFDGEHREFKELPHTYEMDGKTYPLPDNILVRDVEVMFGHDLLKMEDNTLQIYTHQSDYYSPNLEEIENKKDIYLLWCNKSDANEYLGFSDGIYDPDYDEDTFRDEYEAQMKGMTLKAQDLQGNIPQISEALQMYANADLLNEQYKKLSDYINASLYNLYRTFRQNLYAYALPDPLINELVPFVLAADNNKSYILSSTLAALGNSVADIINDRGVDTVPGSVVDIYHVWLNLIGNNVYDHIVAETEPAWPEYTTASQFETFLENVQAYWEHIITTTEENYRKILDKEEGYVFDFPNIRAFTETSEVNWKVIKKNVQATIDKIFKLHKQQDDLEARLKTRLMVDKNIQSIDEEYSIFMDNHANRYCIYWYRYDRNYKSDEDRYMGTHWVRMTEWNNSGRPTEEDELNPGYLVWRCADAENGLRDILMDVYKEKEQFRTVLFYNHEAVYSNILEFENKERVIDTTTGSLSDQIFIELSDYASESFQLYGVNNCLINAQDSRKQRFLRVRYHGLDEQDTALIGTRVYWYIPLNATMLQENAEEMKQMNFSKLESRLAPEAEQMEGLFLEGYDCYYKNINPIVDSNGDIILDADGFPQLDEKDTYFSFHIKDYYNATSTNNTIICRVIKNDRMLEDDQPFVFATFGTSGTDFTVAIYPSTIQAAIINYPKEEVMPGAESVKPLPIKVQFFDYNNEPVQEAHSLLLDWNKNSSFRIAINPPTETYYLYDEDTDEYEPAEMPYLDKNIYYVINEKTGEYQQVPFEKVGVYYLAGEPDSYYHVLEATVEWDKLSGATQADQTIKLKSYYPVAIASGDYYIEGTSMVIYDSLGKNPSYYKEPFKIYYVSDHTEITDVNWSLEWYKKSGVRTLTKVNLDPANSEDRKILRYLPTLTKTRKYNFDLQDEVEGYYFNPLNMFISDMDYYCVAICRRNTGQFLWAQPIIIEQNRYPSSMLNKWDEQLYINEDDSYILASMFGAGYKDDQNRFYGVLMGDVRAAMDDYSITTLGLFGFHEGVQSFGLKVDGTMFLGKAGNGRIEFDGNNGTIRSGNYKPSKYALTQKERDDLVKSKNSTTDQVNTETGRGMMIDLESGWIDAGNFTLTSNFLVMDYRGTKYPFRPYLWIASSKPKYYPLYQPYPFTLMEVTNESFYLQSNNFVWTKDFKDGMKIDLYEGKIWCWNFEIETACMVIDSEGFPYFAIFDLIYDTDGQARRYIDTNELCWTQSPSEKYTESTRIFRGDDGKWYLAYAFLWIGRDRFYIQSKKFSMKEKTGFKMDLWEGSIRAYSGFLLDAPYPVDPLKGTHNEYWDTYQSLAGTITGGGLISAEQYEQIGSPVAKADPDFFTSSSLTGVKNSWPGYNTITNNMFVWQYDGDFKRHYKLSSAWLSRVRTKEGLEQFERIMRFDSKVIYIDSTATDGPVMRIGFGFEVNWDGSLRVSNLNISGGEISLGDPEAYKMYRANAANAYFGFFKVDRYGRLDATDGHLGGWELGWHGGYWVNNGHQTGGRYMFYSSNKHWEGFNKDYQQRDGSTHLYIDGLGAMYACGCPVLVYQGPAKYTLEGWCSVGGESGYAAVTLDLEKIIAEKGARSTGIHIADTYQKEITGLWYEPLMAQSLYS